jgi:hypothetical protein
MVNLKQLPQICSSAFGFATLDILPDTTWVRQRAMRKRLMLNSLARPALLQTVKLILKTMDDCAQTHAARCTDASENLNSSPKVTRTI